MDYRRRKYYLVHLGYWISYEQNLNVLKQEIKSLKLNPPYYHFVNRKLSLIKPGGYDGDHFSILNGLSYTQFMISCKIEESEKLEKVFKTLKNSTHTKPIMVEITKEILGH